MRECDVFSQCELPATVLSAGASRTPGVLPVRVRAGGQGWGSQTDSDDACEESVGMRGTGPPRGCGADARLGSQGAQRDAQKEGPGAQAGSDPQKPRPSLGRRSCHCHTHEEESPRKQCEL